MESVTYQDYLNEKAIASHFIELGNLEEALKHFEKAYQTAYGKTDLDLMVELAFIYDECEKQQKAFRLFHQMIEVDKTFATSYYGLATLYDNNKQYKEAVFYYQKAIYYDEAYEAAHFFLANIYEELGETEKAIYHYEKTIELEPDYFYAYLNIGCLYETSDQNLKAYHYFYKAYQLDETDYMALFNLGVVCRKLGQYKEAIRYYKRSIQVNPIHAYGYLNLAVLYKDIYEDYQKSINIYTVGISKVPDVSVLYYNRACCYVLTNCLDEAMTDLERSLTLSPSLLDYLISDEELAPLKERADYQTRLIEKIST